MAAKGGGTDTDMGLKAIREQIAMLGEKRIKAGIPEGGPSKDGVLVSQYGAWNEYGVRGKKKKWAIPPRPFIRGWLAVKESNIKTTIDKVSKLVIDGKISAEAAFWRLGEFAQDGIRTYIQNGSFTPNADITIHGSKPSKKTGKKFIKGKNSSKPLIDTRTLLRAIRYVVIGKNEPVEGPIG
jgi:hypothetical protein